MLRFLASTVSTSNNAVVEVFLVFFCSNPNAPVKPAPSVEDKPQQHNSDSDVEFSDDDDKQSTSSDSDFTWTGHQLGFMYWEPT